MKLKSQSGFSHIALVLILVVLAAISFAGWKVYDTRKSTSPTTTTNSAPLQQQGQPAAKQPTIPKESYSGEFLTYENQLYALKYPKTGVISSNDFGDGNPTSDTTSLEVIYGEEPNRLTLMKISIEYRVSGKKDPQAIVGTALEAATKSRAVNKADTNPNYKVEVSDITEQTIAGIKAYTFDTHVGFSTGYTEAYPGSGFIMPGAENLRAYFIQTSNGDVIRIVIDKDHPVARQMIEKLIIK